MPTGDTRPSGREVELFNEPVFSELRAYAQIPDDFVNTGWDFNLDMHKTDAKGGTRMAFLGTQYVVKELSGADHKSLLAITQSYGSHIRSGETLLCPIYLHFKDTLSGRFFMVCRNCVGAGHNIAIYDLKACSDDKMIEKDGEKIPAVHKRIWNISMWCGKGLWTRERSVYYEAKQGAATVELPVTAEQRELLLRSIRRDTEWLSKRNLMDYSLLVAIREEPVGPAGGSGPSVMAQRPLVHRGPNGNDIAVYVSIIDFLQKWDVAKRAARCIKVLESRKATVPPSQYGERFFRHFSERFKVIDGEVVPPRPQETLNSRGVVGSVGDVDDKPDFVDRLDSRPTPEEQAASRNKVERPALSVDGPLDTTTEAPRT